MPDHRKGLISDPESRRLVRRLLKENFRLYLGRYLMAFFLMACAAAATAASVFLMKNITMVVFGNPRPPVESGLPPLAASWADRAQQQLTAWLDSWFATSQPGLVHLVEVSVAIVLVFLVKGAAQYGSTVILSRIGNNIVARQQQRIGRHLLGQSLAFFVRFPSADLVTRVSQAANAASGVMNLLMTRVQDLFTAAALLLAMFKLDWLLACTALFVMAPVVILLGNILKRVKKVATSQFHGVIGVVSAIQEAIAGSKLIKSLTLEGHMRGRLDDAVATVERRANKLAAVSARSSPLMEVAGGIAIAAIVFYGGYRNIVHQQGADSLIAFLTALLLAYEPIKRITKMNVVLQASLVGVRMLYDVVDADCAIPDAPDAGPLRLRDGTIALRGVSFAYRKGEPVLQDVSLVCPGGGVTALVGPSGSGKSTVLNLIERFYEADSGVVEIDGQDIRTLKTTSLREQLALVSQDTFLFSDTLRNNIRFARPDATDAEVEEAARAASAHDFILRQPQGYDTQIGENGSNLSGGQRQRISIARAFLKNAPILLLDEATSALDSESEQQVQAAFDRLMQGRTTIVIAHRFSTIRNARTIHVLQHGRLVASGSHDELIRDSTGLYASLYRLQYQER